MGDELGPEALKRFEDMVARLRAEELEDYEIYGCLAKYVSDNLPESSSNEGGAYATVVSYLDKNGITVEEVLSYVNNDAGQLLNNDPLLQRFTGMMDYMENKGLAAEEVFSCLEVFVDSGGQTIYNAFGNLTEIDYFSYATVSGYLNSRAVAVEALRAFLQHTLVHRPDVVASLRPSDDPSFTVGGQGDAMAAAVDVYDNDGMRGGTNGHAHKADVLSVDESYSADMTPPSTSSPRQSNGHHLLDPESPPRAPLIADAVPLDMFEKKANASSKLTEELKHQNELLQRQLASMDHYIQQLEGSRDRADAYLSRLAGSMDGMLAATTKGNTREMTTYRGQLEQLIDHRRALEDTVTYKFSAEDVEGLRAKLRHLHDKLQVNPKSLMSHRAVKERQLVSFHDFIESIEEAEAEVDRLREENHSTMKTLVLKKVELAESQEEVTKTKRALIRAVNKQMQLALKIDSLQAAYDKATSRHNRLLPSFGRRE